MLNNFAFRLYDFLAWRLNKKIIKKKKILIKINLSYLFMKKNKLEIL
jgi:hypothetical protein